MKNTRMHKDYRLYQYWILAFTAITLVNAYLVVYPNYYGGKDYEFAIILPLVHWIGFVIYFLIASWTKIQSGFAHLKKAELEIYRKIFPTWLGMRRLKKSELVSFAFSDEPLANAKTKAVRSHFKGISLIVIQHFVFSLITIIVVVFMISNRMGPQHAYGSGNEPEYRPRNVEEAVDILKVKLIDEDGKERLLHTPGSNLAGYHMSLGRYIRNRFGLRHGNSSLMNSCGETHPDNCSGVIIRALWESLRTDAGMDTVRKLDAQFALVESVRIDCSDFDLAKTGEMLDWLESRFNEESGRMFPDKRYGELQFRIIGDPDRNCYVRAECAPTEPQPLAHIFSWLAFRNAFSVRYRPPYVELNFRQRCCWKMPPAGY